MPEAAGPGRFAMIDDRHARGSCRPPCGGPRSTRPASSTGAYDPSDPLLGAWIEKRFTVIERVAQGGMGKVYKAVQSPMGRIVALKVLSPLCEEAQKPEFHKRFFLEAATVARLVHPNTVTIYDYGKTGDLYYIAMEFLDGTNLRKILNEDGRVHPVRVRHIVLQICKSLQEAHGIGVIHRDLKPENIIVLDSATNREHVKVVDFGLAKAFRTDDVEVKAITGEGLAIGSPSYMSPEQILGEPISPATDVYALGTLMFEMLTGDVPFPGRNRYDTLMAHVHEAPPTLASRLADRQLHPGWQAMVSRCLQKQPSARYAGMDVLIAALKELPGPAPASRPSIPPSAPHARSHASVPPRSVRPSAPPRPVRPSLPPRPIRPSAPPPSAGPQTELLLVGLAVALLVGFALIGLWFHWHR